MTSKTQAVVPAAIPFEIDLAITQSFEDFVAPYPSHGSRLTPVRFIFSNPPSLITAYRDSSGSGKYKVISIEDYCERLSPREQARFDRVMEHNYSTFLSNNPQIAESLKMSGGRPTDSTFSAAVSNKRLPRCASFAKSCLAGSKKVSSVPMNQVKGAQGDFNTCAAYGFAHSLMSAYKRFAKNYRPPIDSVSQETPPSFAGNILPESLYMIGLSEMSRIQSGMSDTSLVQRMSIAKSGESGIDNVEYSLFAEATKEGLSKLIQRNTHNGGQTAKSTEMPSAGIPMILDSTFPAARKHYQDFVMPEINKSLSKLRDLVPTRGNTYSKSSGNENLDALAMEHAHAVNTKPILEEPSDEKPKQGFFAWLMGSKAPASQEQRNLASYSVREMVSEMFQNASGLSDHDILNIDDNSKISQMGGEFAKEFLDPTKLKNITKPWNGTHCDSAELKKMRENFLQALCVETPVTIETSKTDSVSRHIQQVTAWDPQEKAYIVEDSLRGYGTPRKIPEKELCQQMKMRHFLVTDYNEEISIQGYTAK